MFPTCSLLFFRPAAWAIGASNFDPKNMFRVIYPACCVAMPFMVTLMHNKCEGYNSQWQHELSFGMLTNIFGF